MLNNKLPSLSDKKYKSISAFFVHLQDSEFPQILDFISHKIGYGNGYVHMECEDIPGFIEFSFQTSISGKEEKSIVTIEELKEILRPIKNEYLKKYSEEKDIIDKLFAGLDDFKKERSSEEQHQKTYEWSNRQKVNKQNEIRNSKNQVLSNHNFKGQNIELTYCGFDLCYRDSLIDRFKVITDSKKTIINEFQSSIKGRLNSFSFGHKNWIFIPEVYNYYIYNLQDNESFNQTVWLRENQQNRKDSNIGNYFTDDIHFSINLKSCVIFDLFKKEKHVIKPENLLGEISWAYVIDSSKIRFFFNSKNKTAIYNIKKNIFSNIEDIIVNTHHNTLIVTKNYDFNKGNHLIDFLILIDGIEEESFSFIESI